MILLMDGVKYEEWTPPDEATLAGMVKEHSQEMLGPESLYFDIRHKLAGVSVRTIPDAFAITFNPNTWWVVEIELSSHPIRAHIVDQLGGFIAALQNPNTRHRINRELATRLDQEISSSPEKLAAISRNISGQTFRFLSDLVETPPQIVVIIDRRVPELEDAIRALAMPPKVLEFATFCRQGVGLSVHIHQFEPLVKREQALVTPKPGESEKVAETPSKVTVKVGRSTITYGEVRIPRNGLELFPREPGKFEVQTDSFLIEDAHMGSASMKEYVEGPGIRRWIREHDLKPGDRMIFLVMEPKKRYRLSLEKA